MESQIPVIPRDQPIPLSLTQQRLWFIQQLDPDSSSYHVTSALDVSGSLDLEVLRACVRTLMDRHEVLRTAIVDGPDGPLQEIHASVEPPVRLIDLSHMEGSDREERIRRESGEQIRQPLPLDAAPLFRVVIIRVGPDRHRVLIVMHHIITDGWSRSLMLKELSSLYTAAVQAKPASLPSLPLQYADFSVWQRSRVGGDEWRRQLEHWREVLSGPVPRIRLSPMPPADGPPGSRAQTLQLSASKMEALRLVARESRATLFDVLLAALTLLLHRRSHEKTICVGIPSAGRIRSELEGLHGFFVNTLPLKADVDPSVSFQALIRTIAVAKLTALSNESIPFDRIVEEVNPARSEDENPFFDIVVNFIPWKSSHLRFGDAEAVEVRLRETTPKFPLTIYIRPRGPELELEFVYNSRVLSDESVDGLIEQLRHLLSQVLESPGDPVETYSLLSPRHRRLVADPREPIDEVPLSSVPEQFEEVVRRTPRSHALLHGAGSTSYEQLWLSVGGIMNLLRANGVKRGDTVGIACRRDADLVASMLAVLRTGGVMLLLDMRQPPRYLSAVLERARPRFILGHREVVGERFRDFRQGGGVVLWAEEAEVAEPEAVPRADVAPQMNEAAYIFFTSGTTGEPRGIVGSHKGLSHFLTWQRTQFDAGDSDRCPLTMALSFDPVLREILLPLTGGGTLLLPPDDSLSPDRILSWLDEHRVSLLHTTPSTARAWLKDTPDSVALDSLRWIFFSGEGLTDDLVRQWRERFPHSGGVVNLYGPTESTMVKSCFLVPDSPRFGIQPVGLALPQSQLLVLDPREQQCGVEEVGEIVVRSPYITLGYIGGSNGSNGFDVNPFREDPADRIFRTGDLGFVDGEGLLHWSGRRDRQVKVRGVRVEPEGISAILSRHPLVEGCATVVVEDGNGEAHVVAFVVSRDRQCGPDLRKYAAEFLPGALVPDRIVFVDQMPLTPHGKVDQSLLPLPAFSDEASSTEGAEPPKDEIERTIAAIWQEVLHVDEVHRDEDFFDLGGHSLAATRILARINSALNTNVGLGAFFNAQTIAEQAELCRRDIEGSESISGQ